MTVSSNQHGMSIGAKSLDDQMLEGGFQGAAETALHDEHPGGTERIALAEDDPLVRKTIQHLLKELGYQVEAYTSGTEFLDAMSRDGSPIALLLTDHEMPGVKGYELARLFRAEHPEVRVVLASGYARESIVPAGDPQDWPPFIRKPYCLATLAQTLRDVLDGPAPGS